MDFLTSFLITPTVIWSFAIAVLISGCYIFFSFIQAFPQSKTTKSIQQSKSSLLLELWIEKIYDFFDEILWDKVPFWVKSYVLNLFLVILLANLFGMILDIFILPFPFFADKIASPTSDIYFTFVLATTSIILSIFIQIKSQGLSSLLYHAKIFKNTIIAQIFNAFISIFITLLNFIWTIAKVISLAFRLYWNMFAGSILLAIIIWIISQISSQLLSGYQLPIIVPIIFYLQSILTAIIQAFVFSLLTSIFIKMSFEPDN